MALEYRILGPLEVLDGGRQLELGGPLPRSLLALLLLHANEVVPRSRLIDELWAERPPQTAVNVIQGHVSNLRKVLGRDTIVTQGRGYTLVLGGPELDLHRFEDLVAEGSEALAGGREEDAVQSLRQALALWRGPALADLADDGLARAEVGRLEELRIVALERRLEAELAAGSAAELVPELEQHVAEHPLRERLRECQMLALYRAGRQADALSVYRAARVSLSEELGIEPGPALQELQRAILRQDPELRRPRLSEPERSILVAPLDEASLPALLAVAEPLARRPPRELILSRVVGVAADLASTTAALQEARAALLSRGIPARAAAFVSRTQAADLVRLAIEQDVDLILIEGSPGPFDNPVALSVLEESPCDVGLLVAGEPRAGSEYVLVPFAGSAHDWAAVELGAWVAGSQDLSLKLAGPGSDPEGHGRDSSRLLASASLAVQRVLGVAAEPVLVEPGTTELLQAAEESTLIVLGVPDDWRQAGLGRVRLELVNASRSPALLVRRGLRPGGLAPPQSTTRFTWSLQPAAA